MVSNPLPASDRLHAIELLLLWEGRVSRARLVKLLGVRQSTASRDLRIFMGAYPDAMRYDTPTWSYLADPTFKPELTRGQFTEYVQLLGAGEGGGVDTRVGVPFAAAQPAMTEVTHWNFSRLYRAVHDHEAVVIVYRSMNHPEPHVRTIRPHAFCEAGPRWHLRAYCAETADFRDFNLARIESVRPAPSSELPGGEADGDWNTGVELCLEPHDGLTPAQRRLVRDEYCAGTVALVLRVRVAMLPYVIHAYRAAIDPIRAPAPAHLLMVRHPEHLPAHWNRAGDASI